MKLWNKENLTLKEVEQFTIGNDRELDLYLAPYDVIGSIAHTKMLCKVGLINNEEADSLNQELKLIYKKINSNSFTFDDGVEDIHSQIELMLTQKLGDTGKKIHTARSRNDQVLLDIKLFMRDEIEQVVFETKKLFDILTLQSNKYRSYLMPGYTHLQLAMPSSFGLWFASFAESLVDDLTTLQAAYKIVNKNPLGSAAGYGSSFPIDREFTTDLLGFEDLNYNVVYAQAGRGKAERVVASSLANIAATISKLCMDACLYMNQNFAFISFPDELTTGSSIMPHKKNPDVLELIRANGNRLMALPNEIMMITTNLPSGYHRDLQLLKENMFPAFRNLRSSLKMVGIMISNIIVRNDILHDEKYKHLFTVEQVNNLVQEGIPFRDAYHQVAGSIKDNTFSFTKNINHNHTGSIGNLCNDEITSMMNGVIDGFSFAQKNNAINELLN